jgi:hypothetical protein
MLKCFQPMMSRHLTSSAKKDEGSGGCSGRGLASAVTIQRRSSHVVAYLTL